MECHNMRALLSAYVDGALGAQDHARVEKHLAACQACSAALVELRAYINVMGAVKKVKAPADFLQQVHTRLNRRTALEKFIDTLLLPVNVKIPLELAGVAAVSLFIFLIYSSARPPVEVVDQPRWLSVVKPDKIGVQPKVEGRVSPIKPEDEVGAGNVPAAGEMRFKVKILSPLAVAGQTDEEQQATRSGYEHGAAQSSPTTLSDAAAKNKTENVGLVLVPAAGLDADLTQIDPTFSGIQKITQKLGGEIVTVTYTKDVNKPEVIIVKVPTDKYSQFCLELGQLGRLQEPIAAVVSSATPEAVQIQIDCGYPADL